MKASFQPDDQGTRREMTRERSARARAQLREAFGGVLTGSLEALAERLSDHRWLAGFVDANPPVRIRSERLREVLERDRALAAAAAPRVEGPFMCTLVASHPAPHADSKCVDGSAQPAASAPGPVATPPQEVAARAEPAASAPPRAPAACSEPIRTRTMARLLASQGYRDRALAIYAYLQDRDPGDESLRAEADALRCARLCDGVDDIAV